MSILKDYQGIGTKHKLGNVEIELKPIGTTELTEFSLVQEKKGIAESITYLVRETLKASIPGVTDEEISGLSNNEKLKLIPVVLEVNGFKEATKKNEETKTTLDPSTTKTEA